MRDILDPADFWIGTPGGALVAGNKAPVALDDTLSVLKDSGPVTVTVLANDFDPEGQPLTLISASAALGTAVAEVDNTVTYTPPTGISGFDTVVYEIADDLDQRRSGQINITISEPQLSVTTLVDNTLSIVAESGLLNITITSPANFAGSYQVDTADLLGGPVNLVPPVITGLVEIGQTVTAVPGLWVHDSNAGPLQQSLQWRRGAVDITGETAASYVVQAADIGQGLTVRETQTDTAGQRSVISPSAGNIAFSPMADGQLLAWYDASDAATITETGGQVLSWSDKAGGAALAQATGARQPLTGSRSQNGLNTLDFVGGDYLERAAFALPASGDIAIHMAMVLDNVDSAFAAVLALEATNDMQIDADNNLQFDGRLNVTGIGTTIPFSGGPFSGPLILSVVFDQTGTSAEVFIGDTSRGSMAYVAPLDPSVALHLMTNRSRNAWIDGAVCELAITGDVSNRADYHTYLASKWGIT